MSRMQFSSPSPPLCRHTLAEVYDARKAWFTHNDWVREIYDRLSGR